MGRAPQIKMVINKDMMSKLVETERRINEVLASMEN
jgi:hypothetical protein